MSWLRSSPLRQSLMRNSSSGNNNNNSSNGRPLNTTDCDPRACYDSFCKHWQQAYEIIQRSESPQNPSHDDVLGVVSHLDFMVTLLLVELHHCNKIQLPSNDNANTPPPAPCLEYMLSENLLDKLYEWGCTTGRYANAVRLEQLKLYELLVSHSRHQLLCHEPFLRPLLKLLASSLGEIYPPDLEKRLVLLLNQLCVVLMQNVHLLDLFFFSASQKQFQKEPTTNKNTTAEQHKYNSSTNFIIFSLLIPYVHREGSLGHQARDALLLCMALSQKNSNIGIYIAQYSSMCPLLVTGLGGLYSRLPNSIEITSNDWHRITPDDVRDISELTLFMNALEFCNAVVQVAHEMIKQQLLDFMYQGFIVPVLGPAILQTLKGKHFQTNVLSQISAMSYLDLIIRSVTEPELLRAFVRFLLDADKFDGERVLDTLIERLLSPDTNLSMVAMALFDTLLGLHCEDLMLELLLKYVLSGKHVPIAYRNKINHIEPYQNAVDFFLDLTPDVMKRARELTKHKSLGDTVNSSGAQQRVLPSPTSTMSKTIGANWNYYSLQAGDSLYSNYNAYLMDAHWRIAQCKNACKEWSYTYKYQKWPSKSANSQAHAAELVKQFLSEFAHNGLQENGAYFAEKKQLDSLQSIGESSGYESFKWRPNDNEPETASENAINDKKSSSDDEKQLEHNWRVSMKNVDSVLSDIDFSEDLFAQGTISLGPFLNAIWSKLQTFTSNSLYVNLHLTGLITRLACYSLPLVHSLLLRPDIVITSDTPSFHQVLRILKQQIDAELPVGEDSLEIIDIARANLIDREFRLLNTRKANENSAAQISSASPVQVQPASSYDAFKRHETKRKSFGSSITNIFSRKSNGTSANNVTAQSTSGSDWGAQNDFVSSPIQQQQQQQQQEQNSTEMGERDSVHETSLSTLPESLNNMRNDNSTSTSNNEQNSSVHILIGNRAALTHKPISLMTNVNNSEPASLESLSSMGTLANTSGTERTRDLALCAVLLDEWLKELAAIAQEHCVVMINDNI